MTLTFTAVYEGGVLRPSQPLPLDEQAVVQVTVLNGKPLVKTESKTELEARIRATAGILAWGGTSQELQEFLDDPDEGQWGNK